MCMKKKTIVILVLVQMIVVSWMHADVPPMINYQGSLADGSGNPVTGVRSIEFLLYNVPAGGTAVWSETQSVTITNGIFNVLLGQVNPIPASIFDGSAVYLALNVAEDGEMTPRTQLVCSGYAFHAGSSETLGSFDVSEFIRTVDEVAPDTSGNVDLVAGGNVTITPDPDNHQITISSSGGGENAVQTVDAVAPDSNGNVDLVAGSNVTITPNPDNNQITISASTGGGSADNLGNHTATQNVKLNGYWLSGDGGNEGIFVDADGKVLIGPGAAQSLNVKGQIQASKVLGGSEVSAVDFKASNDIAVDGTVTATGGGQVSAVLGGTSNRAVFGIDNGSGNQGVLGRATCGVSGHHTGGNYGYLGTSTDGVYGRGYGGARGVYGYSRDGWGVWGSSGYSVGVYASSGTGWAGWFEGDLKVTETISKGSGSFEIDHPLDPENKYLRHSFVESPDMMNIYNGLVRLDENGEAVVELPEYFEALNRDFRYQLTAIGAPGPDLYIKEKIQNKRFQIAGGSPGLEVSWQVTGIRQDPFARIHPIEVEVDKEGDEKGKYLHPNAYALPENMGINYNDREAVE